MVSGAYSSHPVGPGCPTLVAGFEDTDVALLEWDDLNDRIDWEVRFVLGFVRFLRFRRGVGLRLRAGDGVEVERDVALIVIEPELVLAGRVSLRGRLLAAPSVLTVRVLPRRRWTPPSVSGISRPIRRSSRSMGTPRRSGTSASVPTEHGWSWAARTRRRVSGIPCRPASVSAGRRRGVVVGTGEKCGLAARCTVLGVPNRGFTPRSAGPFCLR